MHDDAKKIAPGAASAALEKTADSTKENAAPAAHASKPDHTSEKERRDPYLGFIDPRSWLGKECGLLARDFQHMRTSAIHTLPGFIVNRGSNLVGFTQLVGEFFMFSASGVSLFAGKKTQNGKQVTDYFHGSFQQWLEKKHPTLSAAKGSGVLPTALRAANPVIEPLYNVTNDIASKGGFNFSAKNLTSAKHWKDSIHALFDFEKASTLDRALNPSGKLINRWQTRGTFLGMLGMGVATIMPDDKDKDEDVRKLSEMATLHPGQYLLHRLKTAINPLEWYDNKRAFTGLMISAVGLCIFLAGFRNVGGDNKYFWNKAHGINGLITATAGSQLILSPTAEQGWSNFGSVMWARVLFMYSSIKRRYDKIDPGRHYYSAGQATFQTGNTMAFLIGGAEVLPDGTVIDHKKTSEEAKKLARAKKEEIKQEKRHGRVAESTSPSSGAPLSTIVANEAHITSPEKSAALVA